MYIRLKNVYQTGERIAGWENVYLAGRMYTRLGERISGWENVYHAGKISGISYHISSLDELIPVWEKRIPVGKNMYLCMCI